MKPMPTGEVEVAPIHDVERAGFLEAGDIDWGQRVISYQRKKTGEYALIRFDAEVETILRGLPAQGPLFPYLRTVRPGDRATEFLQRTRALGILGVSLHS